MLSGQQLENSDHICFWEQLALRQKAVPMDYLASGGILQNFSENCRLSRQLLYKLMPDQVCKSNNWLIWAGHVIPSAIWEPGPCLLLGTIGIETKSSTYGLPGKWWDLTKFPRKLSTIAPAPVIGDAWSGVQIEQLSNLGQALGKSFKIPGRWWHHRQNFLWKSCDVPAPLIKEVFGSSGHQSEVMDSFFCFGNKWPWDKEQKLGTPGKL